MPAFKTITHARQWVHDCSSMAACIGLTELRRTGQDQKGGRRAPASNPNAQLWVVGCFPVCVYRSLARSGGMCHGTAPQCAYLQEGVEVVGGIGPVRQAARAHDGVRQARRLQQLLRLLLELQHSCRPLCR